MMRSSSFLRMTISLPFLIFATLACGPKHQVEWEKYTPETMVEARASGKPILLYFYAAWCGPCMTLKEQTWSDLRVIEALSSYRRLKADMSFQHSEKVQKIGAEYEVEGLPTMLFFDAQGKPVYSQTGFISAERLLTILKKLNN
jgi:thiol:disulfide interchange protein